MHLFFVITNVNRKGGNQWFVMQYHTEVTLEQVRLDAEIVQGTNNMPFGIAAVFPAGDLPDWFRLRKEWLW